MVAAYVVSVAGKDIVHNLGDVSERFPVKIAFPFCLIVASVFEKMQVQSASQSFPMLRR